MYTNKKKKKRDKFIKQFKKQTYRLANPNLRCPVSTVLMASIFVLLAASYSSVSTFNLSFNSLTRAFTIVNLEFAAFNFSVASANAIPVN